MFYVYSSITTNSCWVAVCDVRNGCVYCILQRRYKPGKINIFRIQFSDFNISV